MPGVATADPAHRQPRAPPAPCTASASSAYCRARRVEAAAGREVDAEQPPGADREHQEPGRNEARTASSCAAGGHRGRPRRRHAEVWSRATRQRGEGERHDRPVRARTDRHHRGEARRTPAPPRRGAAGGPGCAPPRCRSARPMAYATRGGSSDPSERTAQRDGAGSLPAGPREGLERRTVANAPDQAERRLRPRARRARSTARPPLVRIRRRNPWVLARLRLFGWNVRFNEEPPRGGRARPEVGDRAGGGNRQVYDPGDATVQRGAQSGETPATPCRTRMPVLRCALRPAAAWPAALPRCVHSSDPADPCTTAERSPHLWTLLWTTSTGRRTRRSGLYQTGPLTGGREKNGDR